MIDVYCRTADQHLLHYLTLDPNVPNTILFPPRTSYSDNLSTAYPCLASPGVYWLSSVTTSVTEVCRPW